MPAWVLWIIAACVFGIGEVLTTGLFLAPFAIGAVVAAMAELVGAGDAIGGVAFIVTSLLVLALLRPIARRHMRSQGALRTGTAALVGRPAIVLERIANHEAVGCVRIDSEVWTARALDDDEVIEVGAHVQVVDIRGATALVSE